MVTLRRKWKQSLKKGSSPGCCLAWCGTIYFVRWLHDVTSQIIAVRSSGLPARPQHVQLYMHISPTVGLRLPAHLTVQANVYTVSLHICLFACLQTAYCVEVAICPAVISDFVYTLPLCYSDCNNVQFHYQISKDIGWVSQNTTLFTV